jgi:hypothetical protein
VNVEPEPLPAPDPAAASSSFDTCPLCGTAAAPADTRCRECNMILAGRGGRPAPFDRGTVWLWAVGLVAVYLVVLVVVVLVR